MTVAHPVAATWTMKSRSRALAWVTRPLTLADTQGALALFDVLTTGPKGGDAQMFARVVSHDGTTVFGVLDDDTLRAMCPLHLLPSVTWGGRPYGLIENVVTAPTHRLRGLGRPAMQAALDHAWAQRAYKVMLLTGQKRGARGFYESVGFSCEDKFGMAIRRATAR